jgi:hypothetical protein
VPATAPDKARIRSYNVGFGDCYLLTFFYPGGDERHVLIDFGSTEYSGFTPEGGLKDVAKQIEDDCDHKLQMVVATHRHTDHIKGFDGKPGEIIRSLDPDIVLQPWTEDPDLEPDARAPAGGGSDGGGPSLSARKMVTRLSDMQAVADAVKREARRLEARGEVTKSVATQLAFLGETNIKNSGAVNNLRTMGGERIYAHFGTEVPVHDLLPGVRLDVLGPPTLDQSSGIATEAHEDAQEFWHLAALRAAATRAAEADDDGGGGPIFPGAPVAEKLAQEARWLMPQVERMRADEMLAIVRILDGVLNNTSLILTFQARDTLLLFPGDAQLENWSYALHECDDREAIRERLKKAAFYKVGHHGSLNATPKTLWKEFARKGGEETRDRLRTMVSTRANKHGSVSRGTEVPRRPLVEELKKSSEFRTTQDIRSKRTFWVDFDFDPL